MRQQGAAALQEESLTRCRLKGANCFALNNTQKKIEHLHQTPQKKTFLPALDIQRLRIHPHIVSNIVTPSMTPFHADRQPSSRSEVCVGLPRSSKSQVSGRVCVELLSWPSFSQVFRLSRGAVGARLAAFGPSGRPLPTSAVNRLWQQGRAIQGRHREAAAVRGGPGAAATGPRHRGAFRARGGAAARATTRNVTRAGVTRRMQESVLCVM